MPYVLFIWRKIWLRNMGVISLSPLPAGATGGCEVVKKSGALRFCVLMLFKESEFHVLSKMPLKYIFGEKCLHLILVFIKTM